MIGFGMPGMTEWIVILVIVLIFFGPGRLPEVFKRAGEGVKAFKDASEGKGEKKGEGAEPAAEEEDEYEEVVVRRKKKPKQLTSGDELDEEEAKESVGASTRKG